MARVLVVLALAPLAAAFRREGAPLVQIVATDAPTPAPAETPIVTCDDITDISLRGQDWTNVVRTVCNFWPVAQFGRFPADTVQSLTNMLQNVFDEGGVWDQLTMLMAERQGNYCLRRETTRELVSASALLETPPECPPVLTDDVLEEMPDETENNRELLDGYWACGTGKGFNRCDCRRRDGFVDNQVYPPISIASRPSGCQMVHSGQCYGSCPRGYRPTFLAGWFRPVCTSVCGETNFPVTCGVGCAGSRSDCVSIILSQVREVAIASSKVAAFFMGGAGAVLLASTVEQVVKVAEFAFNVIAKVLEIVAVAYRRFTREEAELATLVSIFQVLKEGAADVAKDWLVFQGLIRETTGFFVKLIDAEFGWQNINLGWITGAIMRNGLEALTGAFEVSRAFAYAECELATNEVAFVMESVGDDRIIGAWSQDGSTNGKPRYRQIRDRTNILMEWSSRGKSWSIFYLDQTFGRGWWFGWMGLGWRELYETRIDTPSFPTTGWMKVEGSLPLPLIVDAINGGQ